MQVVAEQIEVQCAAAICWDFGLQKFYIWTCKKLWQYIFKGVATYVWGYLQILRFIWLFQWYMIVFCNASH